MSVGVCQQISQEELAKAQQKHADVDLAGEVGLRNRLDDLHRELNEVRVSVYKRNPQSRFSYKLPFSFLSTVNRPMCVLLPCASYLFFFIFNFFIISF